MNDFFQTEAFKLTAAAIGFVILLIVVFFVNKQVFKVLQRRALRTDNKLDDFVLKLFKVPGLAVVYWISAKLFTYFFLDRKSTRLNSSHL